MIKVKVTSLLLGNKKHFPDSACKEVKVLYPTEFMIKQEAPIFREIFLN
jgi:hypothetical protein